MRSMAGPAIQPASPLSCVLLRAREGSLPESRLAARIGGPAILRRGTLVDYFPVDDRGEGFDIFDIVYRAVEEILLDDDHVRELAWLDRAFDLFFEGEP